MSFTKGFKKIAKVVSGVQAYQDRKEANAIKASSKELYNHWKKECEVVGKSVNDSIANLREVQSNCLNTRGRFLRCLKDLNQKNKNYGTASTGKPIKELKGAAANNAMYAKLGGGSIALGGGGIAAGKAAMAAITIKGTVVATGGVAIVAAGIIASRYWSKKLTDAKEHEKAVSIEVEKLKNNIALWKSIQQRADELKEVTLEVESKAIRALDLLESLVPDFDFGSNFHLKSFQQCGLFIKALVELVNVPLTDAQGNMTLESEQIIQKTHTLLNSELERS